MSGQDEEADLPAWQREDIFPKKPSDSPYGVLLKKGKARTFDVFSGLDQHVSNWKESAHLIWTPERECCFPPEEEPRLRAGLLKRKMARADADWSSLRYRAFVLFLPIVYFVWKGLSEGRILQSQELGFMGVLWLMFGGIPAYEAWKRLRGANDINADNLSHEAEEVRFDIWLRGQHVPFTKLLLGLLIGVYLVQVFKGVEGGANFVQALWHPREVWGRELALAGLLEAGLVKNQNGIGYFHGEWWRLFTSPMLHGLLIHIVMNGLGLLYLGRRAEVMASWPHLMMVFFVSMLAGGIASAYGLPNQAMVGASGGIMGLLGFLLVFERLHARLVPKPAVRRLSAGLFFTFVIGFAGYQIIDNWAHGGGLIAGMLYAAIVFPKSSSPHRPRATRMDQVLGASIALVIIASAVVAVARMRGLM